MACRSHCDSAFNTNSSYVSNGKSQDLPRKPSRNIAELSDCLLYQTSSGMSTEFGAMRRIAQRRTGVFAGGPAEGFYAARRPWREIGDPSTWLGTSFRFDLVILSGSEGSGLSRERRVCWIPGPDASLRSAPISNRKLLGAFPYVVLRISTDFSEKMKKSSQHLRPEHRCTYRVRGRLGADFG
jgi:hypothetical protein